MNSRFFWSVVCLVLWFPAVQAQEAFGEGDLRRCGTPTREELIERYGESRFDPSDCSDNLTNPTEAYDPAASYQITVVVHIIMDDNCNVGSLSDDLVHNQIQVLNEDFQAIKGSSGEPGSDAKIQFVLATTDPDGNPTTGITRSCNTSWYNDNGGYYNDLAWDPSRYMNIYTNSGDGSLGYVPFLPANANGSLVGTNADRVVIGHTYFAANTGNHTNFDLGRTATHEVGHFLGLEHTFTNSGGCPSQGTPNCYSDGDLICDTNAELSPNFSSCNDTENDCGELKPIHNYMNYSYDPCMWEFTTEQIRRMRCTLESYRTDLYTIVNNNCDGSDVAVDAGSDVAVCLGSDTELSAGGSGGAGNYSYSWQPTDGLSDPTVANPTAAPTETTTYTVTITDGNGCTAQAQVTVTITDGVAADMYSYWRNEGVGQGYDYDSNNIVNVLDFVHALTACQ
ncbi:Peptidase-M43 domain-containing protein [Sulfidibacter corallicola]|uniref:Peptidase M43 pregnancy-associated plasma-A domain-containing protein n=1 Tax=Sulfidibacter corallicola TaxID=2818388 RepID=A0A8A4TK75_SULCO|nr:M43 family zinc metalloprotease [Sulfidibacter corallicola]QTD49228.1 hypothetical protein J3U87_26890 [Sulfidibacter corallicola]